jgi:hypothetical protein
MERVETIFVMFSGSGAEIFTDNQHFFLPGLDRDELLDFAITNGEEGVDYYFEEEAFDHGYELVPVMGDEMEQDNLIRYALQFQDEWQRV